MNQFPRTLSVVGGPLDGETAPSPAHEHDVLVPRGDEAVYRCLQIPLNDQWVWMVQDEVCILREPDNHAGALALLARDGLFASCSIVPSEFTAEELQTIVRDYLQGGLTMAQEDVLYA